MKDLLVFLSSKEAFIVYFVAFLACFLCVIIYYVEKNNARLKQRHNTRELNKLVSQIKEEVQDDDVSSVSYENPILEQAPESIEAIVVEEKAATNLNTPLVEELIQKTYPVSDTVKEEVEKVEENKEDIVLSNNIIDFEQLPVDEEDDNDLEIQYTTIEPSVSEAQEELKKLTEELKNQSLEKVENIELTNYEEQQEENAIISLEELVLKSKNLYEANELSQYADEGDEPISLQELEKKVGTQAATYTDTFVIENVIPEEDKKEVERTVLEENTVQVIRESAPQVVERVSTGRKFKNSPIISPIYGIEDEHMNEADIELENTANYEKLDAEIKRTSEFLMTLKELQKRLD